MPNSDSATAVLSDCCQPPCPLGPCDDLSAICNTFSDLVQDGGPDEARYPCMKRMMDRIADLRAQGVISDTMNHQLWDDLGRVGSTDTLMGFIYRRPHGYAGDFEIIDKLYTGHVADDPMLRRWDQWIQALDASQAVRNRKAYCCELLQTLARRQSNARVLNVGSGPCRDIAEALPQVHHALHVTCVDIDPAGIEYGKHVLGPLVKQVDFVERNVLRLRFRNEFDLVWSAGLFDYLDDRQFTVALKRLLMATKPGGEIVVGNFSTANPSRSAMEFGNWCLYHRSEEQLRQLAAAAGADPAITDVVAEPLGVNLFLRIAATTQSKRRS